ncbi:MAG TPA: NAD(+)/NADH kinase [Anaerolineae bacterium]|nr:NAD(+)/NADH kinase [Anaerolineae bacterium]
MPTVGIIANPASGKDIRRLVAHGSVFDNQEKVNILRRILLALDAVGVSQAIFMPDYYGLGMRALDGLKLSLAGSFLDMPVRTNDQDSTEAAQRFRDLDVGCIITLGGDGTNRAVAKGCGQVPLVPVSTGTNNVFPSMIEGTVAGLAAGLVATGAVEVDKVTFTSKRLEVRSDDRLVDIALIDVVVCMDLFIGSRALWDPARVREIVLTSAQPGSIGMSAVGSFLHPFDFRDAVGMYLEIGGEGRPPAFAEGRRVLAPIAPGLIVPVEVRRYRLLSLDEEVVLNSDPCTVALDGERTIEVGRDQGLTVRLTKQGPRVVDIHRCMAEAAHAGVFSR